MYTSASATGSTSSVSIEPGPVLSKSVRNELLPVSTRPPPAFPVPVAGLRSEGKALVIELLGPASAAAFRRRTKRKPPTITPRATTPPAIHGQLSMTSSIQSLGGGPAAFLGAAGAALGGAGFASATLGGSAGLGASAGFGASAFGASAGLGA